MGSAGNADTAWAQTRALLRVCTRAGFMPEGMPPDAVKVIAPIMEKVGGWLLSG